MREDEFYMILPSNSSMRYFPENKITCFTTKLPQRVDLHGRWEVALTEIQFPCSFLHIRPGEGLMRFIDITERDKTIKAMKAQVPSGIYSTVRDIIEAVNYTAESVASHIVWQFETVIDGKIIMKLSCEEEKCAITHYVNFSHKLQRILGFDERVKHRDLIQLDSNPISQTFPTWFYNEIGIDIHKNTKKLIKLESTSVISDVLPEWVYDEVYYLLFFVFPRSRMIIADEPASLLRGIPDKLFVYCDICEPYITGDVQSPLLRIVTHDARNDYAFASTQIKHFSPMQYIALRQTCFRTIEIDIRDQQERSISFEFGTLTMTLHLRRID
ncbi:hypothetical protein ACFW04_012982 [Cataglyphis niger]